MAPPSNRRPGYSRKAQYGLFLGFLVAIAGIAVGLLLLVASIVQPNRLSGVRGAALEDLERAPGVSQAVARTIWDHFHPSG